MTESVYGHVAVRIPYFLNLIIIVILLYYADTALNTICVWVSSGLNIDIVSLPANMNEIQRLFSNFYAKPDIIVLSET